MATIAAPPCGGVSGFYMIEVSFRSCRNPSSGSGWGWLL